MKCAQVCTRRGCGCESCWHQYGYWQQHRLLFCLLLSHVPPLGQKPLREEGLLFCTDRAALCGLIAYRLANAIPHIVIHPLNVVGFAAVLLDLGHKLLLARASSLPVAIGLTHIRAAEGLLARRFRIHVYLHKQLEAKRPSSVGG